MQLDYFLLDVFTQERFTGNQLAVVMKADLLSETQMQIIALEFNLSETVFVRQPLTDKHTASLRIFTPKTELQFAGHPTIGAAVLLGLQQRASAVRLEEGIGLITCVMDRVDNDRGTSRFGLPKLPEEIGDAPSADQIAVTLGIAPEDVGCGGLIPGLYSAGVEYYLVPVRNAEVLANIKLERRGWYQIYPVGNNAVYVFTETPDEPHNDYAARMFASGPGMGIPEDAATGSAAAALLGLLAKQVPDGEQSYFKLRQGLEMGRPSQIELQLQVENGKLTRGGIGGGAVVVASGKLNLD